MACLNFLNQSLLKGSTLLFAAAESSEFSILWLSHWVWIRASFNLLATVIYWGKARHSGRSTEACGSSKHLSESRRSAGRGGDVVQRHLSGCGGQSNNPFGHASQDRSPAEVLWRWSELIWCFRLQQTKDDQGTQRKNDCMLESWYRETRHLESVLLRFRTSTKYGVNCFFNEKPLREWEAGPLPNSFLRQCTVLLSLLLLWFCQAFCEMQAANSAKRGHPCFWCFLDQVLVCVVLEFGKGPLQTSAREKVCCHMIICHMIVRPISSTAQSGPCSSLAGLPPPWLRLLHLR